MNVLPSMAMVMASAISLAAPGVSLHTAPGPYEAGEQAFAAGDFPNAVNQLEAAVAGDCDSLRNASEYRRAVIRAGLYDRAIDFYTKLVADHPRSWAAWLNLGYVYVDKMPAAGAITQVILANNAVEAFGKAIEIKPTWIGLYTRGNSYLFWPRVFERWPLAVADLERAVAISKQEPKRPYQARGYAALGDAYWRTGEPARARETWDQGAQLFPEDPGLKARRARQGDDLDNYLDDQLDRTKRVDTDLRPVWEAP
jgi:tetratricopeptide (TPR) repeat protein